MEGIHYDESVGTLAIIDSIHALICMAAAQGNYVYVLDVRSAFQNTIQCDAKKRNYNMLQSFCVEYLCLHWHARPDLTAILDASNLFAIQNFHSMHSMQGQ
jgi:hypothetical protein